MLKHNYIGTEHLLLGLLREEEGLAARVLESLNLTVEEVRAQVARIVGEGDEVTTGQIPFTPRAKKVLELSLREALSLGHNYIGTEHILLGSRARTMASQCKSCSTSTPTRRRSAPRSSACSAAPSPWQRPAARIHSSSRGGAVLFPPGRRSSQAPRVFAAGLLAGWLIWA